jgi:hypothetical protein
MAIVIKKQPVSSKSNKAKALVLREAGAFLVLLSVSSGSICFWLTAYAFCKVIYQSFETTIVVAALITSLMALPKSYREIKKSSAPYLIRFALGFKAGFCAGFSTAKRIEKLVRHIHRLLSHSVTKPSSKP